MTEYEDNEIDDVRHRIRPGKIPLRLFSILQCRDTMYLRFNGLRLHTAVTMACNPTDKEMDRSTQAFPDIGLDSEERTENRSMQNFPWLRRGRTPDCLDVFAGNDAGSD